MKPVSSRLKLTFQQTASCGTLLLLFACAAYVIASRAALQEFDLRLADHSAAIRSLVAMHDRPASVDSAASISSLRTGIQDSFYEVVDASGRTVSKSDIRYVLPLTTNAKQVLLTHRSARETERLQDGREVRVLNTLLLEGEAPYLLRVWMPLDDVAQQRRQYAFALLVALALFVGLYGATMWFSNGRMVRQFSILSAAANGIDAAELERRFPAYGDREVGELASSLNAMMARLEGPFRHLQEFPPNLSHELRRPLTNLRAEAENALRNAKTEEEYRAVLTRQLEQVDLITATMTDLLELARFGSQPLRAKKQEQSLSELLSASVDSMLPSAQAKGITLTAEIPEGIVGAIDTWQICRVLQNLIDNGIKYGRPNGTVHVKAVQEKDATSIVISDDGIGIPAADLASVFERTFRSSTAKRSCVQGSGLGLYFVKMAVDAHGGTIGLESTEGQGTSVRIALPGTRQIANRDESTGSTALSAS